VEKEGKRTRPRRNDENSGNNISDGKEQKLKRMTI
jgi:hypothetical protein